MQLLMFVLSALRHQCAFIDLDGCLLHRMRVPDCIPRFDRLNWWTANLRPTPIVKRRLALLYFLRLLGVELFVWTNRGPEHDMVTRRALGRHVDLFEELLYGNGRKTEIIVWGPVMEDSIENIAWGRGHSLLVKQI